MVVRNFDYLLEQLYATAPHLNATRLMLLNGMALALQAKFDIALNPNSDFATPEFCEYFASRLLIHHAVVEEKLNKKSFEYVFRDALRHTGRAANITTSNVHPGADLIVDGTKVSLKTEASKNIRDTKITISKFMEARWIRDQDAQSLAQLSSNRLREHLAGYDRIMMLRAFDIARNQVKYDLVEIPHNLLSLATQLKPNDITLNQGRSGGGSALVLQNTQNAFTLKFDGSVEKITIANLPVEFCTIHATWSIPLMIDSFEASI